MCVDFIDLNKARPKDDFPLPHIEGTCIAVIHRRHLRIQSDKDGFRGYRKNVLYHPMGDLLLEGHAIWP